MVISHPGICCYDPAHTYAYIRLLVSPEHNHAHGAKRCGERTWRTSFHIGCACRLDHALCVEATEKEIAAKSGTLQFKQRIRLIRPLMSQELCVGYFYVMVHVISQTHFFCVPLSFMMRL